MCMFHHIPVLKDEVIEALNPQDGKTFIDATFGGGGHTKALLDSCDCRVIGFDRDPDAIHHAQPLLEQYKDRLTLIQSDFGHLYAKKRQHDFLAVDGILFDFGVSSYQIDTAKRGFSFLQDGPLDMRMDPSLKKSAADLIAAISEGDLMHILKEYGEEKQAKRIARAIIAERKLAKIETTNHLKEIIETVIPANRHNKIHPATRSFQAIRIAVNQELDQIHMVLKDLYKLLKVGGRGVFISFHSLEDRIVKSFIKQETEKPAVYSRHVPYNEPEFYPVYKTVWKGTKKPSAEEIKRNPRSRSSKLRAIERLSIL